MDAISYTAARADLAKTMERVCNDHSPANARRLLESITELETGKGATRQLNE